MSQTPNDRHPDIEIYVHKRSLQRIQLWLESIFDQLEPAGQTGNSHRFIATGSDQQIPITVIEKAAPGYTSIWFDSDQTPWPRDLDCARQALSQLECEIRCIASGWQEGDEPDEWWSVSHNGEQKIQWGG
jgi:hypothetical protein